MRKPVKTYNRTVRGGSAAGSSVVRLTTFGFRSRTAKPSAGEIGSAVFVAYTRRGAERHDDCDCDVWRRARRATAEKSRFCSRPCAPSPSIRRASIRREWGRETFHPIIRYAENEYIYTRTLSLSLSCRHRRSPFPYIVLLIDGKPSRKTVSSVVR